MKWAGNTDWLFRKRGTGPETEWIEINEDCVWDRALYLYYDEEPLRMTGTTAIAPSHEDDYAASLLVLAMAESMPERTKRTQPGPAFKVHGFHGKGRAQMPYDLICDVMTASEPVLLVDLDEVWEW